MSTDVEMVRVLDVRCVVPEWLYQAVVELVIEVVPVLEHGTEYTAEDLCGEAFWEPLSHRQRQLVGHVMVHLVKAGSVPLMFADYSCRSPKRYIRKP